MDHKNHHLADGSSRDISHFFHTLSNTHHHHTRAGGDAGGYGEASLTVCVWVWVCVCVCMCVWVSVWVWVHVCDVCVCVWCVCVWVWCGCVWVSFWYTIFICKVLTSISDIQTSVQEQMALYFGHIAGGHHIQFIVSVYQPPCFNHHCSRGIRVYLWADASTPHLDVLCWTQGQNKSGGGAEKAQGGRPRDRGGGNCIDTVCVCVYVQVDTFSICT